MHSVRFVANEERLALLAAKQTMDLVPQGLDRMVTREEVITAIDNTIREQSTPDRPQLRYLDTMETVMGFVDERIRDGAWRVLRTAPERPFVVGDAPVVTWERNEQGELILGKDSPSQTSRFSCHSFRPRVCTPSPQWSERDGCVRHRPMK